MSAHRPRDTQDTDNGGQAPTVDLASINAREDETDPSDPRIREGATAHREWCREREQRRRARESSTEQQTRLTAYGDAAQGER